VFNTKQKCGDRQTTQKDACAKCQDEISYGKEREKKQSTKRVVEGGEGKKKRTRLRAGGVCVRSNEAEEKSKKSGKAPAHYLGPRTWRGSAGGRICPWRVDWWTTSGESPAQSNPSRAIVASVNWKYPGLDLLAVWVTVGLRTGLFFAQLEPLIIDRFGFGMNGKQ